MNILLEKLRDSCAGCAGWWLSGRNVRWNFWSASVCRKGVVVVKCQAAKH